MAGTVWYTYLLLAKAPLADAGKEAGRAYSKAAKENSEKTAEDQCDMGPPYIHIWLAVITALLQVQDLKPIRKAQLQVYYNEFLCQKSMEEIADSVKYIRIKDAYTDGKKEAKSKLIWAVAHLSIAAKIGDEEETVSTLEEVLVDALKAQSLKAVRKEGSAPRSELERVAQKLLDQRSSGKGKKDNMKEQELE